MNEQALLYDQVYKNLRKQISKMEIGSKLPTIRQTMQEYNVSLSTINKAYETLREEGYIVSRVGRGTFVSSPDPKHGPVTQQVDILHYGYEKNFEYDGYINDLITRLTMALGQEHNSVRVTSIPPEDKYARTIDIIDNLRPKTVITINLFHGELPSLLASRNIAHLHLTPNWPIELPNSIYIDNASIASIWASHLEQLGHRRIVFLHGVHPKWYFHDMVEREKLFYQQCAIRNITPVHTAFAGYNPEEGYQAVKSIITNDVDFTAIVTNDHVASGVYKALSEKGLIVGKDISVIGCDDLSFSGHLHPALTTIRIPRDEIVEQAILAFHESAQTKADIPAKRISCQLIQRESTNPKEN